MTDARPGPDHALYTISVAAELAGISPQTLRLYEQRGLITPARTQGGTRRYSDNDIARLNRISELVAAGVNLTGVRHILELEDENTRLRETEPAQQRADSADEWG
ncbi:heat shock protein transcriptional repressor HspR [Salinactinospora qingdaonensis]|uniref:MerR family transcriptional regulator n=1 Tax=Salinactinospora qingdaonensis TaxID=702744 RepID=A0ABP7FF55_9ACTN